MSFTIRILLSDSLDGRVYLDRSSGSTGDYQTIPRLLDDAHRELAHYLGAVGAYAVVKGFALGSPADIDSSTVDSASESTS